MFGRDIFRKTSLEKMTTPEDLDELLQVNSAHTWLLLGAISVMLAGMLVWGFLGTITQEIKGFGIIKIQELPREVLAGHTGQIDSVFCKTGNLVDRDQKLMIISFVEEKSHTTVCSPFKGKITVLNVKEGSYVQTGFPLLELLKSCDSIATPPEVIFFVTGQGVAKLKKGMIANLKTDNGETFPELLKGTITFISEYPSTKTAVQKYFNDEGRYSQLKSDNLYEVRASMTFAGKGKNAPENSKLHSINGVSCLVTVTVARQHPVAFLFN